MPTQTLQQTLPDAVAAEAVLLVRIWRAGAADTLPPISWEETTPAVCLVTDSLRASGARVQQPHGNTQEAGLVSEFPNVAAAALAARRLLWAMDGLVSETLESPGGSEGSQSDLGIAVLIRPRGDAANFQALDAALARASGGQILLAREVAAALEAEPGFLVNGGVGAKLKELSWRMESVAKAASRNRAEDEALIDTMLAERGLPVPGTSLAGGANSGKGGAIRGQGSGQDTEEHVPGKLVPKSRKVPLWLLGAVAAALIVVAVVFAVGHRSPELQAAQAAPVAETAGGSGSNVPSNVLNGSASKGLMTANPGGQKGISPSGASGRKSTELTGLQSGKDAARNGVKDLPKMEVAAEPAKPQPVRATGRCQLDISEWQDTLDRGEASKARGAYNDAERQFREVLDCDPQNGRAKDGLEQVRRARQASGGSSN